MATAVYPNMAPVAQDSLQVLLCKAGYWAQSIAGAGPFPAGMFINMTPFAQDPIQVLAVKLAYWLQQAAGGGGGSGGIAGTTNMALGGVAPPVDGSVATYRVFDTDTGFSWYNSGTIAAPIWNNV